MMALLIDFRDKYHRNALFATHCFSFNDCALLKDTLLKNFGIRVSVCKCQMRGKMYYRLYVYSESMNLFEDTVRPFIHKDYAYKIRSCQRPAAAVIRVPRALSGITGRKGCVGGCVSLLLNSSA